MRDARLDRLADVIVGYSTRVKKGDVVAIVAEPGAQPLVEALYSKVLKAGGNPHWVVRSEALQGIMLREGSEEQIKAVSPFDMHLVETADVRIVLWAEVNTKAFGRVDSSRLAMQQAARKPMLKRFMERAATGELRWCGTLYPTAASAQDAEMSLDEYADFVFRAGKLDLADPVAAWRSVHERQERVREALQKCKGVRFFVPAHDGHDGTDLRVDVSPPSVWVNCAGHENFPDGEVFAGPQGAEGHVNYTFPAVYQGREVEGVRLVFKGGRVVEASAKKNEEFLIKMLDQDAGARTMGEIAIGTNYSIRDFSKNTLFDEKIGGTFHAAVGAGYPESGSTNESGLHWDMVCDLRGLNGKPGGVIEADGKVISRNGKFVDAGWPGE
ncbi:MAG: aminopeptidase [Phycisphaerales bacterium]|jgi:aminopeptidase|nr:aminopeptidase [Phycisphaerales bacterium]